MADLQLLGPTTRKLIAELVTVSPDRSDWVLGSLALQTLPKNVQCTPQKPNLNILTEL